MENSAQKTERFSKKSPVEPLNKSESLEERSDVQEGDEVEGEIIQEINISLESAREQQEDVKESEQHRSSSLSPPPAKEKKSADKRSTS